MLITKAQLAKVVLGATKLPFIFLYFTDIVISVKLFTDLNLYTA